MTSLRGRHLAAGRRARHLAVTIRLAVAGAALVGRGAPLLGQTISPRDSSVLAGLADRLRGQGRARVRLKDGQEVELVDPSLDGDSLRFSAVAATHGGTDTLPGTGARAIAFADVMRVQVRRTAAGKGAILGLILGGAALAIRDRTGNPPTWDHNETLFFGMIGGVLGSVVGGVIGAPFRGWTTVYQASRPGPPACGHVNATPSGGGQRAYTNGLRARAARCMLLRPLG